MEIITSAATHAFLPLVLTEEAMYAQIKTGSICMSGILVAVRAGSGCRSAGRTGVGSDLQECGLEFFFTDAHGIELAEPKPVFGTMSPVLTPHGVAAFPRDEECSKQVWSSIEGYPGDYDYREYYRDIGYDLEFETVKPYIHPEGIRVNTGIKYFRITGTGDHKEPYHSEWAREKAAQHAGHFLHNREKQVEHASYHMGRKPLIVATYDAELFGHWWYEGPMWIDFLLRKMHFDQDTIKTIAPSEYLRLYSDFQMCRAADEFVGARRIRGCVAARVTMTGCIRCCTIWRRTWWSWRIASSEPDPLQRRALNQAARELMLAQSSDWAFIMDNKTMVDYAVKRTKHHVNRFEKLDEMLETGHR